MFYIVLLGLIGHVMASEMIEAIDVKADKEYSDFFYGSSESYSEPQLEKSATPLLGSRLDQTSGVISTQAGGPGSTTSYFIRGTESRHVGFTIDGLKMNDPSNTERFFDSAFLTTPFLKSAEVYKGPQSVLFGSDALGGLVDMKSRKGENAPEGRLNLSGGSFGTVSSSLGKDWATQNHRGTLTWSDFHTDGISRLNRKRFNAKEKDSADITQFSSSSEHNWKNKWQTDFLVSYLHGKNELDGNSDDNSYDHSKNDQYLAQQKTHYEINHSTAISLRNGLNRHQRFITTLGSGEQDYQGNLKQNELLMKKESKNYSILSGFSFDSESFTTEKVRKDISLQSIFAQSALKFNELSLQLGGRLDHHTLYGNFHTGSSGIKYKNLSLQYSQGFKAPSLYQLYGPNFGNYIVGNKELVPERNHATELKWETKNDFSSLNMALFQNNLSNLIVYTSQGYKNQGKFTSEGLEISAKFKKEKYEVNPHFTYQQFKHQQSPVLRRPLNQFQTSFAFFPQENLELFLKLIKSGARKDLDTNGKVVKLNGHETIDLGWRLTKERYDLGMQILNVLNREYEDLFGFSVMPRSVFINLGYRF
ncbi:MAG: TonB-dependent receptor plug domain-containing protein [Bacteriovoracaceae bacterium]